MNQPSSYVLICILVGSTKYFGLPPNTKTPSNYESNCPKYYRRLSLPTINIKNKKTSNEI